MSKVRYWDNLTARWIFKHFYFTFFQIILVAIFIFWFYNIFNIIDANVQIHKTDTFGRILATHSNLLAIIVILMIFNSFWMLYIFNTLQRSHNLLKDMIYQLSRLRSKDK